VTFGFVDRGECSVELVGHRIRLYIGIRAPSGLLWTPSRPLPFCCPRSSWGTLPGSDLKEPFACNPRLCGFRRGSAGDRERIRLLLVESNRDPILDLGCMLVASPAANTVSRDRQP
jgi:hypothetical protein